MAGICNTFNSDAEGGLPESDEEYWGHISKWADVEFNTKWVYNWFLIGSFYLFPFIL